MTYAYDPKFPDVDLYEHLEKIRPRPVMWIGVKDIFILEAHIGGMTTLSHNSLCNGPKVYNLISEPDFDGHDDQEGFAEFVRRRRHTNAPKMQWAKALVLAALHEHGLDTAGPEARAHAVDLFFEDLDQFRKHHDS